tara:strand:+ start:256 stop:777 length:522 start_codon:yes stop_codon:yes gene_type:complete
MLNCLMPLYTVVPLTSRLEDLIAAVILGPPTQFPVQEKDTVLQQYAQSDGLADLKQAILATVRLITPLYLSANIFEGKSIRSAAGHDVDIPRTKPTALLRLSGHLMTGPAEIAIITPLVGSADIKGKSVYFWRHGDEIRQEAKMESGLIIIRPEVCYIIPEDIPFVPMFCKVK